MSENQKSPNGLIILFLLLKVIGIITVKDVIVEFDSINDLVNNLVVLLLPAMSLILFYKKKKNGYTTAALSSLFLLPSLIGYSFSAVIVTQINFENSLFLISLILELVFLYLLWRDYRVSDYSWIDRDIINTYIDEKISINNTKLKILEIALVSASIILGFCLGVLACLFVLWLDDISWSSVGLFRPNSWIHTIGTGLSFGIGWSFLLFLFNYFLIILTGVPFNSSIELEGDPTLIISTLVSFVMFVWLEDLIIRGYIQKELTSLLGKHKFSLVVSIILGSVIWAVSHYQSWTGLISLVFAGVFLGTIYEESEGNLWIPIIIHLVYDIIVLGMNIMV